MNASAGELLSKINYPSDLKRFSLKDLPQISRELRDFIIDVVSNNPGHFGASLGVVELTVALHYIYNAPYDGIIWEITVSGIEPIELGGEYRARDARIGPKLTIPVPVDLHRIFTYVM